MCYHKDYTLINNVAIPSIRSKSSLERSHPIGTRKERPKSSYHSPRHIISENTLEPFQSSKPKKSQEEVLHCQPGFRFGLNYFDKMKVWASSIDLKKYILVQGTVQTRISWSDYYGSIDGDYFIITQACVKSRHATGQDC